jgi:hypothetical protein
MTVDALLNIADQLMYQRKRHGKHGLMFDAYPLNDSQTMALNPDGIARRNPRSA